MEITIEENARPQEVWVSIQKMEGGFVVESGAEDQLESNKKIVRKLSEVVSFVKTVLADE